MGQIKNIKLHIVTDIKGRGILNTFIMQIFVNGAKTDVYDVSPSITIGDLKELIEFRSGVSFDNQVLTYAGRPLTDEQSLTEGDIQESSTVYLGERLLGGKVNGQTPKVDAQEKKKPKTGRAKRRQQYNSRFVNVVVIPGRRRGPNSNAA